MTDNDFLKQLKNLKFKPEAGALPKERGNLMYIDLMEKIDEDLRLNPSSYTPKLWFLRGFGFRNCFQYVLVTCLALAIGIGGSITAVSASFNSLPGDTLYTIKLATERVQLALAQDEAMKINLHAKFAGRRIEEMKDIIESSLENKESRIEEAVQKFNTELNNVNISLQNLGDPKIATGTIKFIDQKMEELNDIIVQNAIELPKELLLKLNVPEESTNVEENTPETPTSSPELPEPVWQPTPEVEIPEAPKKIQWQIIIEE